MPLLQWLNSGENVTTLLILYSRTHILPLLNQCSTAALAQLLSLHSESSILPLLSRHYMAYMSTFWVYTMGYILCHYWASSSAHMTSYWYPHQRVMLKIIQSTALLCSFHMLSKLMLKILCARCQSIWTKNFQIYTMDLEKAEEWGLILPTFIAY